MEPPTPESEFARSLMDNAVNHFDLSTYKYVVQYPIICAHIVSMSSCAACPVFGARPAGLRLLDLPISLRSTCGNTWQLARYRACMLLSKETGLPCVKSHPDLRCRQISSDTGNLAWHFGDVNGMPGSTAALRMPAFWSEDQPAPDSQPSVQASHCVVLARAAEHLFSGI